LKLHLQADSDTLSQCIKLITANYTVYRYLLIYFPVHKWIRNVIFFAV